MVRGVSRRVSHAPTTSGWGHSVPQFWRLLSIYAYKPYTYTLCRRTTKFDARAEEACIQGQPRTPPLPRAEFQGSPIWGVILYLCLHPLTQNDQIRHSNTGSARVLGDQPPRHAFAQIRRAVCQQYVVDKERSAP